MRPLLGLALLLSACAASPTAQTRPNELRWTIVVSTRPAGAAVTTVEPDGTRVTQLAIVDNGRGPKVTSRARLAPDGTLASFEATGTETFGAPVAERFAIEQGVARWKSTLEQGERPVTGPAFYVPTAPSVGNAALLARALRAAGGKLALLPEGEARLEQEAHLDLEHGGKKRRVTSYLLLGLDLVPTRVWLDETGELFALVEASFAAIAEGWEPVVPTIMKAQQPLDAQRAAELARRVSRRPPLAGLAFVHARVFDAPGKRWLPDQTVLLQADRIVAVGPTSSVPVPPGSEVIDAAGKALLPGLWDTHAHLSRGEGELDVAAGVTTIRDVGNDPDYVDDQKQRFDDGSAIGPRIVRAGFVEGRGPNATGSAVTAETEAEAIAAVDHYARRGWEELKIYNSVKPSLVPVLAAEAHRRGLRVSGHVPVGLLAAGAVRAGYDEIQHINQVMLNFFADETTDTATLARFTLIAEHGAALDLGSAEVRDFVGLLKQKKTVVTPTLDAFEDLYLQKPGDLPRGYQPLAERLPPVFKRGLRGGGLQIPEGQEATWRAAFPAMQRFVKLLWDAGVTLTAGTDSIPGLLLPYELQLLVESGLPAADVLQMATLGAARTLLRDRTSGSIEPGKDADLVLVDGDPLERIGDLRKVVTVVRGGTVYDAATLFEAVGVKAPAR